MKRIAIIEYFYNDNNEQCFVPVGPSGRVVQEGALSDWEHGAPLLPTDSIIFSDKDHRVIMRRVPATENAVHRYACNEGALTVFHNDEISRRIWVRMAALSEAARRKARLCIPTAEHSSESGFTRYALDLTYINDAIYVSVSSRRQGEKLVAEAAQAFLNNEASRVLVGSSGAFYRIISNREILTSRYMRVHDVDMDQYPHFAELFAAILKEVGGVEGLKLISDTTFTREGRDWSFSDQE